MNFTKKLETLNLADINARSIQESEVQFISKDFIPLAQNSYNLITGAGGSGKSYIALQILVREAKKGKRCLAWSTEDAAGTTKHRIKTICEKILNYSDKQTDFVMSRIDILDMNFSHRFVKKTQTGATLDPNDFTSFVEFLLKYDVAILDPLKAYHGADESDNSQMDLLVRDLFQIGAEKSKCTIAVIHHTPKGGSEDRISSRGASTIADSARLGLEIVPYMTKKEINGREMYVKDKDKETILQVYPRKDNHNANRFFTNGYDFIAFPAREREEPIPIEVIEYKDDDVLVSISKDITENFKTKKVPFEKLKDLVKSDFNYSMSVFKDGYRKKDNYIQGSSVIALDVDDGMSLNEARILFEPYKHIIATTKSHQKSKNGVVCDRYRVLLKTSEIKLNAEDFSEMMREIHREFPFVDTQCSDPSRFYYPAKDCEIFYTDGFMEFEWGVYHNRAKARREVEKMKVNQPTVVALNDGSKADWYRANWKTDKMLDKLRHSEKFVEGQRNGTLYSWAKYFKEDLGLSDAEVVDAIYWLNDKGDSVNEKEINTTIFKSLRIAI